MPALRARDRSEAVCRSRGPPTAFANDLQAGEKRAVNRPSNRKSLPIVSIVWGLDF